MISWYNIDAFAILLSGRLRSNVRVPFISDAFRTTYELAALETSVFTNNWGVARTAIGHEGALAKRIADA